MHGLNQSTSPSKELVKTALDKLYADEMRTVARTGKAEATDPVVFTQDRATNAAVVSTTIGGGGYFESGTDDLALNKGVAVKASSPKTTLILQFRKDLNVSRTFMADQQQSAVAKSVRQQTRSWLASRDRNAFSKYAGGFATVTTIDSAYLFSNSHSNENGDTVDNLETGVLADGALNTAIVSLRNQKDQTGVKVGYEPDFLLVPNQLHKTGMEVAKSVLRSGTGNNDLNYYSELYPGMKVVYNQFLDDTSTTAWFVGAANHGLVRFEREAFFTAIVNWETQSNDAYIYKMRAREEVDAIEYCGLVGSNGTV